MKCLWCDKELEEVRLFCSSECRRESNKMSLSVKGLLYEPMKGGYFGKE